MKIPAEIHIGKVVGVVVDSCGYVFVIRRGNINGPAHGGPREFGAEANQFARSAIICMPVFAYSFAHLVKTDRSGSREKPDWAVSIFRKDSYP
jgi:hypothetical protein